MIPAPTNVDQRLLKHRGLDAWDRSRIIADIIAAEGERRCQVRGCAFPRPCPEHNVQRPPGFQTYARLMQAERRPSIGVRVVA